MIVWGVLKDWACTIKSRSSRKVKGREWRNFRGQSRWPSQNSRARAVEACLCTMSHEIRVSIWLHREKRPKIGQNWLLKKIFRPARWDCQICHHRWQILTDFNSTRIITLQPRLTKICRLLLPNQTSNPLKFSIITTMRNFWLNRLELVKRIRLLCEVRPAETTIIWVIFPMPKMQPTKISRPLSKSVQLNQ